MSTPEIKPGRYRHYKGKDYEVLGVARHSETEEWLVVYRCLYGDQSLWVRPLELFEDEVTVEGRTVKRFERIRDRLGRQQCPNSLKWKRPAAGLSRTLWGKRFSGW